MADTDHTIEEWLKVAENPLYEVSNHGRVRRAVGGKGTIAGYVLSANRDAYGYPAVQLFANGKGYRRKVHTLVCIAFNGPRPACGYEVAHWDGVRHNNTPENLRWATRAENMADAARHGTLAPHRGSSSRNSLLTEADVADIRSRPRRRGLLYDLAKQYGISRNVVGNIRTRTSGCWPHVPFPDHDSPPFRRADSKI